MYFFREKGCTHFVGMATHDSGGLDVDFDGPLMPGMVITCDHFTALPGENIGVRIEDTVLITNDGQEGPSQDLPQEVEEIEALMMKQGIA
jgi:Xaa-Pro aminopeptidase